MKPRKIVIILTLLLFSVITISAQNVSSHQGHMQMSKTTETKIQKAICVLYPTQGNNVTGIIIFTKTDGGIKVVADIQGLGKGKHGFHIHECGDCSSADGSSAGGHFNPGMKSHGAPTDMTRHAGDLGNVEADDSGKAHLEYTDNMITFEGKYSIIGRSVIVHKNEDDFKTQPTGNAGARVACGVIGISK